ncbi:glycogen synthase GlgA [Propionispora hippei]|uniref:Glycogen synthase n=1 Tax=Propionispora hippei DSM 15287 TaxID=1123003 RepID=A0A1M6BHY7_9FIRM|nr:glycogen synthase GlgA [Propionispora hippei]SHI48390.1 starch synthase [Propionispora hippei DSM 15287]
MLKVLFAAAEAVPFVKTGGLGDVIGTLPRELKKQGVDVRVILPKHGVIPEKYKRQMVLKQTLEVAVSWRKQYCGIEELEYEGITCYFVDNQYYFGSRPAAYGHHDEAECYTYFCRAVLECLPVLDFQPDILHCHDWHTALIPVFLQAQYRLNPFYQQMKTLFTIHNLRYQGRFAKEIVPDILGLDWEYFNNGSIEYHDSVNFMKGGLIFADLISTVSRSYAEEIQYPFFGEGLDGLLRHRRKQLIGIINGIDYNEYDPAADEVLHTHYDANSPELKQKNKRSLQEKLGLPRVDIPVIGIVSRLVGPKGFDLVANILFELLGSEDIQLVVLGTGEGKYEELFRHAAWRYPDRVSANIFFDDALAHQIYAGADLFLMPSLFEPCGIGQLIAMRYGALPVVRETGGLKDTVQSFNRITGQGTGFTFDNYNAHDMLFTIRRAIRYYYDKENWLKIVRNAMAKDFSWHASAQAYLDVYQKLVNHEL